MARSETPRTAIRNRLAPAEAFFLVAFAVAGTAQAVMAQTVELQRRLAVSVGIENSDNPSRLESIDPESLTYEVVGLDVALAHEGRRLEANIDGLLKRYRYDTQELGDQTLGRLEAGMNWRPVPSLFSWDIRNVSGDIRQDPFRVPGPENRERLNDFSMGPDIQVPITERNFFTLRGRRSERDWESSSRLDSSVVSGDVLISRSLSSAMRIGLGVNSRRVEYDEPNASTYDVDNLYLSFTRQGGRSSNSLDIGSSRLARNGASERSPYLDWEWRARIASRSVLGMSTSRQVEDAGDQLNRSVEDTFDPSTGDVALTAAPIERKRFQLSYSLERPRTQYSFSTDWSEEIYEGSDLLDRQRRRTSVSILHPLTRAAGLRFTISSSREKFPESASAARDSWISAEVDRRMSEGISVGLRYSYFERDSKMLASYSEHRASLAMTWTPLR